MFFPCCRRYADIRRYRVSLGTRIFYAQGGKIICINRKTVLTRQVYCRRFCGIVRTKHACMRQTVFDGAFQKRRKQLLLRPFVFALQKKHICGVCRWKSGTKSRKIARTEKSIQIFHPQNSIFRLFAGRYGLTIFSRCCIINPNADFFAQ